MKFLILCEYILFFRTTATNLLPSLTYWYESGMDLISIFWLYYYYLRIELEASYFVLEVANTFFEQVPIEQGQKYLSYEKIWT